MPRAIQAGTSAPIQFEREGGARPAAGTIAPSSTRACTAATRNARGTGTMSIRHSARIASSIDGALVRSTCRGAIANCSLLEASSTTACAGWRSSLAEMTGKSSTRTHANASSDLRHGTSVVRADLRRFRTKAARAPIASPSQIRLSKSSMMAAAVVYNSISTVRKQACHSLVELTRYSKTRLPAT
jgi:hypothetical protein